jgi:hypothetical protein
MADCGCTAVRASGDPAGRSITSLGGLAGRRKKKGARKAKRKSTKAKKGSHCVRFKSGKKRCFSTAKGAANAVKLFKAKRV